MPVTLNIARKPVAPPAEIAAPPKNDRARDRRKDPMGPVSRRIMAGGEITTKDVKDALEELRPCANRMSYYMEYASWWAANQRSIAARDAAEKKDFKTARGILKQLWKLYVDTMANGVFDRRWGDEPVDS